MEWTTSKTNVHDWRYNSHCHFKVKVYIATNFNQWWEKYVLPIEYKLVI